MIIENIVGPNNVKVDCDDQNPNIFRINQDMTNSTHINSSNSDEGLIEPLQGKGKSLNFGIVTDTKVEAFSKVRCQNQA